MPCEGPSPYEQLSYKETEISNLREMLCSACRSLSKLGFDFGVNPMLDKWWDQHQKEDRAREAEEIRINNERTLAKNVAQTKLINELTVDEKQLLKRYNFL